MSANFIAKWDIMNSSWSALGSGISNDDVWAIVPSGTDALYVGGQFSTAGNLSANRVSKWDDSGINWSALGTGISGNYNIVTSLVEIGGVLYAGGSFTTAGNANANNIAKYSCSSITTSVYNDGTSDPLPQQFQIAQNYPNPFNPTTTIRYDLPKAGFVKISVYDILGREVKVLVNEEKTPGHYEIIFDAKNLASGIYFYTIRTAGFTQSKKMILMK